MSEKPGRLSRIGVAALFSTAAVFGACRPEVKTTLPQPYAVEISSSDIDRYVSYYYPELRGRIPLQIGTFETNRGTRIHWLNYTNSIFDEEPIKKTFSYFQDNIEHIKKEEVIKDFYKSVTISSRPSTGEKVLFIVPKNTPIISAGPAVGKTEAATLIRGQEAIMSFVRYEPSPKDPYVPELDDLGFFLPVAVEACQQGVMVSTIRELEDYFQEVLCNSWGVAFAIKQTTFSYDTYVSTKQKFGRFPNTQPLIISEEFYNQIPIVGRVLSD